MPQPSKYTCKSCYQEVKIDVPDIEDIVRFGDKVPCSFCGKVGCNYFGPA